MSADLLIRRIRHLILRVCFIVWGLGFASGGVATWLVMR